MDSKAVCNEIGSCTAGDNRLSLADLSYVPGYRRLNRTSFERHFKPFDHLNDFSNSEENNQKVKNGNPYFSVVGDETAINNVSGKIFIKDRMVRSEQSYATTLKSDEETEPTSDSDATVEVIQQHSVSIMRMQEDDDHDEEEDHHEEGPEEDHDEGEEHEEDHDKEEGHEEDHDEEEEHEEDHDEEEEHEEDHDEGGEHEEDHGEEEGHGEGGHDDHDEEGPEEDHDTGHSHDHSVEVAACNNVERSWEEYCYFLTKEPVPGYRSVTECSKAFPDAEFAEIPSDEANDMASEYVRQLDENSGKPLHLRILYVYIKDDEEKYKKNSKRFNPTEDWFKQGICDMVGCQCVALRSTTGSWHRRICDTRHYALCRRPHHHPVEEASTELTVGDIFDEKESSTGTRAAAALPFVTVLITTLLMTVVRLSSATY